MSIEVRFYNFSKRPNSTKRPGSATFTHYCELRDRCSIYEPVLDMALGFTGETATGINYAYIPSFNRYYFVRDWSWNLGVWTCQLQCDVLATYKTQIGNSTQYVIRAASEAACDPLLTDTLYPAEADLDVTNSILTTFTLGGLPGNNTNPGCFVIGVLNQSISNLGAVTYYLMNKDNFSLFKNVLFSNSGSATDLFNKYSNNPIQYITSCKWYPFSVTEIINSPDVGLTEVRTIGVGCAYNVAWSSVSTTWPQRIDTPIYHKSQTYNFGSHPDADAQTRYLHRTPYTSHEINSPIFGTIQIDATTLESQSSDNKASIHQWVDLTSGDAVMRVYADSGLSSTPSALVGEGHGQMGTDIKLASSALNVIGAIGGSAATVAGVAMTAAGNPAGLISAASGILSSANSLIPTIQSTGNSGSFLNSAWYNSSTVKQPLYTIWSRKYLRLSGTDPDDRGYPVCKPLTISTLSGYVLCSDVDIALSATQAERDQVKSYMEGGFFYE